MPVEISFEPTEITKADFQNVDFKILGHAYAIQNAYGNQLDEKTYQDELAHRLIRNGMEIRSEAGVVLSHGPFRRRYECDLVINDSVIVECKAMPDIVQAHKRQLLHYLFLTGLRYGRMINFRPASVQKWIMSNNVSEKERRTPEVIYDSWREPSDSFSLSTLVKRLVADWGTGLFRGCYAAGLAENISGILRQSQLSLKDGGRIIGKKMFDRLGESSALFVTVYSGDLSQKKQNLQRLLSLTSLEEMHWVNVDLHRVTLSRITPKTQG